MTCIQRHVAVIVWLQKISIIPVLSMENFLFWLSQPFGISSLASYFPLQILAVDTLPPWNFWWPSIGVGQNIFCNHTLYTIYYTYSVFLNSNRSILAALHFNYNVKRETKRDDQGKAVLHVFYPKFKDGEATVREVKVPSNYGTGYIHINKYCYSNNNNNNNNNSNSNSNSNNYSGISTKWLFFH